MFGAIGDLFSSSSIADTVGMGSGGAAAASGGAPTSGVLGGLGSLISGAAPFIGGAVSGAANYASTADTNRTNAEIAQQANQAAMDRQQETQTWEADMANTAEQRQVSDFKAAGLNPMLALHGSGAAVPNVSAPPVSVPSYQNGLGGAVTGGINTGLSVAAAQKNMALTDATTRTQLSVGDKAQSDADSANLDMLRKSADLNAGSWEAAQELARAQAARAVSDANSAATQARIRENDLSISNADVLRSRQQMDVNSSWAGRNVMPWLDRLQPFVPFSGFSGRIGHGALDSLSQP